MGSGKTTFGKYLAESLDIEFVDLDEVLVLKHTMSISEMFKSKGEKWFRAEETHELEKLMKEDNKILSLGGGTPLYNDNIDLINDRSISFYLKSSVQKLFKNLQYNKDRRPLIANLSDKKLFDFIQKNLSIREGIYKKAKHTLNFDNDSYETNVTEVKRIIDLYK
jgi:shikimate kinase